MFGTISGYLLSSSRYRLTREQLWSLISARASTSLDLRRGDIHQFQISNVSDCLDLVRSRLGLFFFWVQKLLQKYSSPPTWQPLCGIHWYSSGIKFQRLIDTMKGELGATINASMLPGFPCFSGKMNTLPVSPFLYRDYQRNVLSIYVCFRGSPPINGLRSTTKFDQ